jgi:prophage regulatory protein
MTTTATAPDSLIRLPEVLKKTGLSRSTVLRLVKANKFPSQRKLLDSGVRNAPVAWSANEVQAWIDQRKNPANDGERK